MSYEDALKMVLGQIPTPKGQEWVTLSDLKKAAERLDDDTHRSVN